MSPMHAHRAILVASLALALLPLGSRSLSQAVSPPKQSPQTRTNERFAHAESRWRLNTTDIQSQRDDVSPTVRSARNAYWKPIIQALRDQEEEAAAHGLTLSDGGGGYRLATPEVPLTSGSTWVIARFDRYKVFSIDKDYRLLYTEKYFKVVEIIHQPPTGSLTVGGFFETDVIGGKVRTPGGKIISWGIVPERYSVQPDHTYLLQLLPMQAGLFGFGKQWDVSSGKLVPDDRDEVNRAADGESHLSGMSIAKAIDYLQGVFSQGNAQ